MSLRRCSGSLGEDGEAWTGTAPMGSPAACHWDRLSGFAWACSWLRKEQPRPVLTLAAQCCVTQIVSINACPNYTKSHPRPASIRRRATCLRFSPVRDSAALSVAFSTVSSDAARITSTCAGWPWYGLMRPCARYVRRRVFCQ